MTQSTTVAVTLKAHHTHAGVKHASGATLSLSQADADWLITNQFAELTAAAENTEQVRPQKKPPSVPIT